MSVKPLTRHLDLECVNEELSETVSMQFNLHSCYYNDFFLLRTFIAINGTPVEIKIVPSGTSLIQHSESGLDYPLSNLVPGVATTLSEKHGVYHIDTFYHEEAALFSVVFPSQSGLRKFLEHKDKVESDLVELLSTQFVARPQAQSGQESQLQVSIDAELFLASPTRSLIEQEEQSPSVCKVTLATFHHFIEKWQQSKLFIFNSSMFSGDRVMSKHSSQAEEAKLKDLQRELKGVDTWFQLGLELDIPDDELRIIRKNNILFGVEQCLLEVLIHWRDREKPTWTKVVGALVKIGRHVLAENIAKKYGIQLPEIPVLTTEKNTDTVAHVCERQLTIKQHNLDTAVQSRDTLIDNIESHSAKLMDLQEQNNVMMREIEELKHYLQYKRKGNEYLEESQKMMKSSWKETVERMKKETNEQIKHLQQQLAMKNNQLTQIQEQLEQKEKELKEKIAEIEEKSALVTQLQEEVEKLKQSFREQQQELNLRQIESTAYSLSSHKHLEEVKLQLKHIKCETDAKKKEIEAHSQNLATRNEQISQLSLMIKKNETKVVKLQEETMSESEEKILKLSLCVKMIHLKEKLKAVEHAKWLTQFKLKKAQEYLRKYKTAVPDITKCTVSLPQKKLEKHTLSHLRVCLFDEDGDPCSGSHNIDTKLTLLADDSIVAGTFSKLVKDNSGEYVVSFTPTRAGDCEIQVTVNGTPLPAGTVSVASSNKPDITKCTMNLPQKKLEKHTLSHLRVCLFDEDGDPCSGSHNIDTKLTLLADDSIVAGTFSKLVKDNSGEYVVSFTPTRAGDCEIQVTVNGTPLPAGTVSVASSNKPDITKCTMNLPQKKLEKHTLSHLRVCLFDEDGDPCSGSHNIDTKLTLLADDSIVAGTFSKLVKDNSGEYVVSFTPTRAGDCEIQVTVNGTPLPAGTVSVASSNKPDIPKCTMNLPQKKLEKHTLSHLRVCLFDEDGDPCSGSHNIDTKLTLLTDDSIVAGIFSKPVKDKPGEYVVSFTPTRAGDFEIQVTVNGTPLPSGPLNVVVFNYAEPDIQLSYATGGGLRVAEKDLKTECQVVLLDSDSDPCWMKDDSDPYLRTLWDNKEDNQQQINLIAELIHYKSKSTTHPKIEKHKNGHYKITYQPTKRGKHLLNIKINQREIEGSPFAIAVTSSPHSLGRPVKTIDNLHQPLFVTTNHKNQIIVTEYSCHCVSVFSPEGKKIHSFGSNGMQFGEFCYPAGVTVDNFGNIYVVDNNNHRIQKFSSDRKFVQSVGTHGGGQLEFNCPLGITFNLRNQKLYVCDQRNHCVKVLNTDFTYYNTIGREGTGNGEFIDTVDITSNRNGDIYVTDCYNHRVQIFNQNGSFLRTLSLVRSLQYPYSIAVDSSNTVYVSERDKDFVSMFIADEESYRVTIIGGTKRHRFKWPRGLHVDKNDSLLVCDFGNGQIQLF